MMGGNGSVLSYQWPREFNVIPQDVFYREDIYRLELERIFHGPDWHPVAHVSEIPKPGDVKTMNIGEAPVLAVHGDDGKFRVFYNTCPHRGTQLQTCPRTSGATEIECPYHRWVFNLRGNLLAAPGIDEFPADFRKANFGLKELRSGIVSGLVLATCSPDAPDLETFLGEAREFIDLALGAEPLELIGYQKVVYAGNWKEYGDNEGYHPPLLHRAFRLMKWQGGKGVNGVTRFGHKIIEAGLTDPAGNFLADPTLVERRDKSGAAKSYIAALWPMTTIAHHLDVINIRFAFPRSPHETEVHYAYFGPVGEDAEVRRHRIRQASNLLGPSGFISLEDGAVFNRLHQGSLAAGTVAYQKGYKAPLAAPWHGKQNDEAPNLIRWERYRDMMGFARG